MLFAASTPNAVDGQEERPEVCDAFCPEPTPPAPTCLPGTMYQCRHCYLWDYNRYFPYSNEWEGLRTDRSCPQGYYGPATYFWSWAECGFCGI